MEKTDPDGRKTLRVRQSSDESSTWKMTVSTCLVSHGGRSLTPNWTQGAPNVIALKMGTPRVSSAMGGANRSSPIGGTAKGIPTSARMHGGLDLVVLVSQICPRAYPRRTRPSRCPQTPEISRLRYDYSLLYAPCMRWVATRRQTPCISANLLLNLIQHSPMRPICQKKVKAVHKL